MKRYTKLIFIEIGILVCYTISKILLNSSYMEMVPTCYIKETFNINCITCGGTRCLINFVNGNFIESFKYHPVFFILFCYLIILNITFIIDTIRNKKTTWIYPKYWYAYILAFALIIQFIYRNI